MSWRRCASIVITPVSTSSRVTGEKYNRVSNAFWNASHSVLSGKRTNYDTDLFVPILDATAARAGVQRGADEETDTSLRVIADHARAFCFLMADSVAPGNDGRGYVLRRLLRRAIRHGTQVGLDRPFFHEGCGTVIERAGGFNLDRDAIKQG